VFCPVSITWEKESVLQKGLKQKSTDKRKHNRYFLLYELFQSISSTLDPQKALNLIIDAAVEITGATSGSLCLVDWQKGVLNIEVTRGFVQPLGDLKLKVGEGITGWVAQTGDALLIRNTARDPRYVQVKQDIKSELAVPLNIDGKLIGVVNVDSIKLNAFDIEDLELLVLLSNQSAQVIQNSRLFDTVARKVAELSTLIEINKTIAGTLALDKILSEIVRRTAKLMDSRLCSLRLLSENGESLVLRAHHGGSPAYSNNPVISVKDSLVGRVILTGRPLQVADVKKEADYSLSDFAQQEGLASLLSVPLKARRKIIGVININKAKSHHFSSEEIKLLRTFADLCAIAIENARLYEKMLTLEEQIRRADRLAAVGELAAGVAHEIRNPLTIIKMIFEAGTSLNQRDVEVIGEELDRMNNMVGHFLKFARPGEPNLQFCNVNKNLDNVLLLVSHAIDEKAIVLKQHLDFQIPNVFVDPVQLQQVLLNIIINSIEAIANRGVIEITSESTDGGRVRIIVKDNGGGIPAAVQKNLFVPFSTTKPKGLGLGLSIAHRILKTYKGKLTIDSTEGAGTTVVIELPAGKTSEEIASYGGPGN
jgi:signal transduction histidine kinase